MNIVTLLIALSYIVSSKGEKPASIKPELKPPQPAQTSMNVGTDEFNMFSFVFL